MQQPRNTRVTIGDEEKHNYEFERVTSPSNSDVPMMEALLRTIPPDQLHDVLQQAASVIPQSPSVVVITRTSLCLGQVQGNFLIRWAQAETAMELNMGESKSSVIIPIAAATLADSKQPA